MHALKQQQQQRRRRRGGIEFRILGFHFISTVGDCSFDEAHNNRGFVGCGSDLVGEERWR